MSVKICWNFLILCGVLSQGIIGTLSEKDIDESSELLVRQKRVINRNPGGDIRHQNKDVPYVVYIKPFRIPTSCVGVILTQNIVLTVSTCVELEISTYRIVAGSSRILASSHGDIHLITNKIILNGTHPHRPDDGIALVAVSPSFRFSGFIRNIQLYEGFIPGGTLGTVSGWGCHAEGHPGTEHQFYLRSITVPIISYHDCAILYLDRYAITERDICTFDTNGHQYCGADDTGAPLVIKERGVNKLVGVHLRKIGDAGHTNPDIFVDLRNSRYKTWIQQTIHYLAAHLSNPYQRPTSVHNPRNQENLHHPHNLPH